MTFAQSPWLLAVGVVLAGSAGGWVWAPYSDIVTRAVPLRQQPRALAIITTGTSGGLLLLGGLAVTAAPGACPPSTRSPAKVMSLLQILPVRHERRRTNVRQPGHV
ncbi:hypothetical protein [Kocuria sp. CH-021]|uniref:hypothetical protein n=1 Tax=Kocuria sp. CH-021 TaxID=3406735 RepID=UPI003C7739E6